MIAENVVSLACLVVKATLSSLVVLFSLVFVEGFLFSCHFFLSLRLAFIFPFISLSGFNLCFLIQLRGLEIQPALGITELITSTADNFYVLITFMGNFQW